MCAEGSKSIWVIAEQEDNKIHPVTYELLGKGRELADKSASKLCSVLLGYQIEKEAKQYCTKQPKTTSFNCLHKGKLLFSQR